MPDLDALARAGYEESSRLFLNGFGHALDPKDYAWEQQSDSLKEDWRCVVRAILKAERDECQTSTNA